MSVIIHQNVYHNIRSQQIINNNYMFNNYFRYKLYRMTNRFSCQDIEEYIKQFQISM